MSDLLFEIGTEELPASFIEPALNFLETSLAKELQAQRLSFDKIQVEGTPRRLVTIVLGLAAQQDDLKEEVTGPKVEIAWGQDGRLSKAGEGFLRSRGLSADDAYKKETKKGDVIAAQVFTKGKSAQAILPDLLQNLMGKIPFKKVMRWGDERIPFARPIQWILALLDDEVIPFRFVDVSSGSQTQGHRFHAPFAREVASIDDYRAVLAAGRVILSQEARRDAIRKQSQDLAASVGGVWIEDEALVKITANLVEHPWPLLGSFEKNFLEIPKEILISEMREHQKCFAIEGKDGALLPYFIVVAGSEPPNKEQVAAGNARVIKARFEDGGFYYKLDVKKTLVEHAEGLEKVIFQRDLGTIADKTRRIKELALFMADEMDSSKDAKNIVAQAALLCKADLVTGVVGEFPELQGVMGRIYARAHDEKPQLAEAIEMHYWPRFNGDQVPTTHEAAFIAMADRIDTLCGIIGIGKTPKGSADPFGLRRASIDLVQIMMTLDIHIPLSAMIQKGVALLVDRIKGDAKEIEGQVLGFIRARLPGVLQEHCEKEGLLGVRDILGGAIEAGTDNLPDLWARTHALASLRDAAKDDFGVLAATFKRVGNIVRKAKEDGQYTDETNWDATSLVEPAEKALWDSFRHMQSKSRGNNEADLQKHYRTMLEEITQLKPAVDKFFDDVLVMADDDALRKARLGMLSEVQGFLMHVADFTRIHTEG